MSAEERATIQVAVGSRPQHWIEETYWPSVLSHKYLSWMHILACHGPRRWRPDARLVGKEHLDRALEHGRGALLFTATFAYRDLMTMAAFAKEGCGISHLSMDSHGFSGTRFGKSILNPIYTSVEERYLGERLVFSAGDTRTVRGRLGERLQQNRAVMITVTPLGRHIASRSFLHGRIRIATGGLNLACENGTPVLPVFTLRQADGSTVTMVGSALERPEDADNARKIDSMLDDYVSRLEGYVASHPDQFCYPLSSRSGELLLDPSKETSVCAAPFHDDPLEADKAA